MIKPQRLQLGDTIQLISPSSPSDTVGSLKTAIEVLGGLGYRIKYNDTLFNRQGFLAGTDEERAKDLMSAFEDPEVKGIICTRGGYGATRLLDLLDYEKIRANPKVFMGFSDITALNCAFLEKCGLVSFSGPVVTSDLESGKLNPESWDFVKRLLGDREPVGSVLEWMDSKPGVNIISGGVATGQLVGGNLSLLCNLIGTPWMPNLEGAILFLEDVGESTYRIDRYLTHLRNAGLLQKVAGIALGDFRYTEAREKRDKDLGIQLMDDVLVDRLGGLGVPVVSGFPFGHIKPKLTLPLGVMATLDGEKGDLVIEEGAVE